jgi:hypothetical protein
MQQRLQGWGGWQVSAVTGEPLCCALVAHVPGSLQILACSSTNHEATLQQQQQM